jgi:hypothetical protein
MWEGYVALGVALLFVGFLLYGTHRRTEEFTTMRGSYPTTEDIKKTVRAIMDQYYDYNISEFNKIDDINEILKTAGFKGDTFGDLGMPQSSQMTARVALAFVIGKTPNDAAYQTKQAKEFYSSFKPFATSGYSYTSIDSVEALIESLHMYRKWLTAKIKNYKNDGKPNIEMDRHAPIEEMLDISLKLDVVSLYLKNTLTRGFLKLAMEKTSPKPKAA